MKKVILILGIAATLTSCQKDELEGLNVAPTNTTTDVTSDVTQVTDAHGVWEVNSMSSFSGDILPVTTDRVIINGNVYSTVSFTDGNMELTSETFYVEFGQLYTDNDRLILSISDTGELTIMYTVERVILKANRI